MLSSRWRVRLSAERRSARRSATSCGSGWARWRSATSGRRRARPRRWPSDALPRLDNAMRLIFTSVSYFQCDYIFVNDVINFLHLQRFVRSSSRPGRAPVVLIVFYIRLRRILDYFRIFLNIVKSFDKLKVVCIIDAWSIVSHFETPMIVLFGHPAFGWKWLYKKKLIVKFKDVICLVRGPRGAGPLVVRSS